MSGNYLAVGYNVKVDVRFVSASQAWWGTRMFTNFPALVSVVDVVG
jgi:hypothetical protein